MRGYIHAAASLVMEVEDKNRIAPILIFVCCLFFTNSDSNACDSAQRNDESSRESIAASMAVQWHCMLLPFQTRVDATGSLTCLHWIHTGRPLWRRRVTTPATASISYGASMVISERRCWWSSPSATGMIPHLDNVKSRELRTKISDSIPEEIHLGHGKLSGLSFGMALRS